MSNLKHIRKIKGYTQKELSEAAGVELRSIQAYEQGQRDINLVSALTLYKLSYVLGCYMEDLMEPVKEEENGKKKSGALLP